MSTSLPVSINSSPVPMSRGTDGYNSLSRNTSTSLHDEEADESLSPSMSRVPSPARISFAASTNFRVKSRVSSRSKSATYSVQPLKPGESPALRFKPPVATEPFLQFVSPWISVTKIDYRDPSGFRDSSGQNSLSGHYSEGSSSPGVSGETQMPIQKDTLPNWFYRSKSTIFAKPRIQTPVTGIGQDFDSKIHKQYPINKSEHVVVSTSQLITNRQQKSKQIRVSGSFPEGQDNYYCGYLPPHLAKEMDALRTHLPQTTILEKVAPRSIYKHGPNFKSMGGSRTHFLEDEHRGGTEDFTQNMNKVRSQGRVRLLENTGIRPSHFTVLEDRGPISRPRQQGRNTDEIYRAQMKLARTQNGGSLSNGFARERSSLEAFQRQKEKTYSMQAQLKEMLKAA